MENPVAINGDINYEWMVDISLCYWFYSRVYVCW